MAAIFGDISQFDHVSALFSVLELEYGFIFFFFFFFFSIVTKYVAKKVH